MEDCVCVCVCARMCMKNLQKGIKSHGANMVIDEQ